LKDWYPYLRQGFAYAGYLKVHNKRLVLSLRAAEHEQKQLKSVEEIAVGPFQIYSYTLDDGGTVLLQIPKRSLEESEEETNDAITAIMRTIASRRIVAE
jgi:hypothetical protein